MLDFRKHIKQWLELKGRIGVSYNTPHGVNYNRSFVVSYNTCLQLSFFLLSTLSANTYFLAMIVNQQYQCFHHNLLCYSVTPQLFCVSVRQNCTANLCVARLFAIMLPNLFVFPFLLIFKCSSLSCTISRHFPSMLTKLRLWPSRYDLDFTVRKSQFESLVQKIFRIGQQILHFSCNESRHLLENWCELVSCLFTPQFDTFSFFFSPFDALIVLETFCPWHRFKHK